MYRFSNAPECLKAISYMEVLKEEIDGCVASFDQTTEFGNSLINGHHYAEKEVSVFIDFILTKKHISSYKYRT